MKNISTTVRTVDPYVGTGTSKECTTDDTQEEDFHWKTTQMMDIPNGETFLKEAENLSRKETETENEMHKPGSLFKVNQTMNESRVSVEDESDRRLMKLTIKRNRDRHMYV
ncbi:unnamed protein product [Parnassius mnemosyne]|uniref:Uncharacterized protein n=1 Tax=Parnassius mnemosyne TaxID=213953 RepID=A0AAV1LGF7_9NEOP